MAADLPPGWRVLAAGWRGPSSVPGCDDWVEKPAQVVPARKVWKLAKREADPFVTQAIAPLRTRVVELEALLSRVVAEVPPYALPDDLAGALASSAQGRPSYPKAWTSHARDRIRRIEQRRDFLQVKIAEAEAEQRVPNHHNIAECSALSWAIPFLRTILGDDDA